MEVLKRLEIVFRDFFDDDSLTINENTVASDIDGWDSLEHITLMAVIEQEFKIKFDVSKHFQNVGEMAKEITRLSQGR